MEWILSLRLPARRPLLPGTSVVIRDVVVLVDELMAEAVVWERASLNPVGMRTRLAVSAFKALSLWRFDMSGGKMTRVHQDGENMKNNDVK